MMVKKLANNDIRDTRAKAMDLLFVLQMKDGGYLQQLGVHLAESCPKAGKLNKYCIKYCNGETLHQVIKVKVYGLLARMDTLQRLTRQCAPNDFQTLQSKPKDPPVFDPIKKRSKTELNEALTETLPKAFSMMEFWLAHLLACLKYLEASREDLGFTMLMLELKFKQTLLQSFEDGQILLIAFLDHIEFLERHGGSLYWKKKLRDYWRPKPHIAKHRHQINIIT